MRPRQEWEKSRQMTNEMDCVCAQDGGMFVAKQYGVGNREWNAD